jgi:glycosyl transferase family 87
VAQRPPLPLAAATVAAGWGAIYSIWRWIYGFATFPVHEDVRYDYVAAQVGLRYGWSRIYDMDTLRAVSSRFAENTIGAGGTYIHPPLLAWLFVPLVAFQEPVAYLVWTLVSLGLLVWMWHMAAPYSGLTKFALLLTALALWPVMEVFYYGYPTMILLALVTYGWWLMRRGHMSAAGFALAFATVLKPQVVVMIPICLLVTGRIRTVVAWAAGCAVLAALSAAALGSAGLSGYWQALMAVQSDTGHAYFTVAYLFGIGYAAYGILALQGAGCLLVAWRRRDDLEVVFAAGLLGSLMVSFHLHQPDYSNLVLAAWLVLRGTTSLAHKAWLAIGIVPMQVMTTEGPVPQLVWNIVWLVILGLGESAPGRAMVRAAPSAAPAE